jgi:hypothetical protein
MLLLALVPNPGASSPLVPPKGEVRLQDVDVCGELFGAMIKKREANVLRVGFQNIGGFPIKKK